MSSRKLQLAVVLASILLLAGCASATSRAEKLLPAIRREAGSVAGSRYDVSVALSEVDTAGLQATYGVVITSKEYPAFQMRIQTERDLAPQRDLIGGGLHDWPLFRVLDAWDQARRVAFLAYLVDEGTPQAQYASLLSVPWPGAEWDADTQFGRQLRQIGADKGIGPENLAWVEVGKTDRLLGYDTDSKSWSLLASRSAGGSGALTVQ